MFRRIILGLAGMVFVSGAATHQGWRRVLFAVLAAFFLIMAVSACEKQIPTTDPAWTYQLAGDSVTWQAGYYGGDMHGANTTDLVGIGWEPQHAQPQLDENIYTEGHSPRRFAMAFGLNFRDRYTSEESNQLFTMVFSPHDSACVVIVLPYTYAADSIIQQVRRDLVTLRQSRADQGKPTITVDWKPIVQAHPEYIDTDRVHISPYDGNGDGRRDGSVAFANMLWSGVSQCP